MVLYGIASALSGNVDDWYLTSEEAEAALAEIFRDEPDFEGRLWVELLRYEQSLN